MKTRNYNLKARSFTLLMIILGLFVTINIYAQDDDEKKKVRIKKVTEVNGEKVVVDTVMYIDDIEDLQDMDIMKDVHIEHVDGDHSDKTKNIWVSIDDDDDDTHIIKTSSEGAKTIIIKTKSGGNEEDIRMIIESEIDDEDIKIEVVDGDTIIKKTVKKVTVEAEEEGTYTIYINDEDADVVTEKTMIFISDDGDTEVIESDGEHKYVVIKKDKDGNISKDGEKTMIWVSDDGEKIEIKEIGEDGDLKWVSEDGEEHEIDGKKVIVKEIEVIIEDVDDSDDDDGKSKDKDKKKKKDK